MSKIKYMKNGDDFYVFKAESLTEVLNFEDDSFKPVEHELSELADISPVYSYSGLWNGKNEPEYMNGPLYSDEYCTKEIKIDGVEKHFVYR